MNDALCYVTMLTVENAVLVRGGIFEITTTHVMCTLSSGSIAIELDSGECYYIDDSPNIVVRPMIHTGVKLDYLVYDGMQSDRQLIELWSVSGQILATVDVTEYGRLYEHTVMLPVLDRHDDIVYARVSCYLFMLRIQSC